MTHRYALNWCNKYNYDPVVIDVDIRRFNVEVRSNYMTYAEESKCCSNIRMASTYG